MHTNDGIVVGSWVILEESDPIEMALFDDNVEFEFRTSGGEFSLTIHENMIDRLTERLTQAKQHFDEINRQRLAADNIVA